MKVLEAWPPAMKKSLILIEAVHAERYRQLYLLLEAGVDVNCQDPNTGHTSLIRAMFVENPRQRRRMVKTLINYGGKIEKSDVDGRTALAWACCLARNDIIRFFLRAVHLNIGLNSVDKYGNNNLMLACTSGNPNTVHLLAEAFRQANIDVNRRNLNEENALMYSHRLGFYDCVKVLVEGGYVRTSMSKELLYGDERKVMSTIAAPSILHSSNNEITLPQIFSMYSDHLTDSFPRSLSKQCSLKSLSNRKHCK